MPPGSIPRDVRRFVDTHIDSVETLDVLLLLRREQRDWTVAEVARELRGSPGSVRDRLSRLAEHGLVAAGSGTEPSYRYAPARPAEDGVVEDLAAAYAHRRVSVISLIYSKSTDQVTTFADAFRFKRSSE